MVTAHKAVSSSNNNDTNTWYVYLLVCLSSIQGNLKKYILLLVDMWYQLKEKKVESLSLPDELWPLVTVELINCILQDKVDVYVTKSDIVNWESSDTSMF